MILSDRTLRFQMDGGFIVIDPKPQDHHIQPASIDLHLAGGIKEFMACFGAFIDVNGVQDMRSHTMGDEGYVLPPGHFILGSTVERIEVPSHLVARVEGKSSLGRIGLAVHVTAGFIDPGFRGNITLELKNLNNIPVRIKKGMAISQLCFETMTTEAARPYGSKGLRSRYQDSVGTRSARG